MCQNFVDILAFNRQTENRISKQITEKISNSFCFVKFLLIWNDETKKVPKLCFQHEIFHFKRKFIDLILDTCYI